MSYAGAVLYFLATAAAIGGAIGTVVSRSAIRAAIWLLFAMLGVAGLYLGLSAEFLSVAQIIVYAGAIVVLFIFVIMMLGTNATTSIADRRTLLTRLAGAAAIVATVGATGWALARGSAFALHLFAGGNPGLGAPAPLALELFSSQLVVLEISGVLLLSTIVAVIAIAQRQKPIPPNGKQTTGDRS